MALVKLTFDGANNTAKMDAYINAFLTSYQIGIINGLGDSLSYTIANGKITFGSGVVSVYGRRVYVEEGTSIDIPLDSTKYGYVVMNINTATNEVSMTTVESTSSIINLQRDNLIQVDGLYQFVMCAYKKTASSLITNEDVKRSYIKTTNQQLQTMQSTIENQFKYRYIRRYSKVGCVNKFNMNGFDLENSLVIIPINYRVTIAIPGTMMGTGRSLQSTEYNYLGSTYSMTCERGQDGYLYLTTANSNHDISIIYIFN